MRRRAFPLWCLGLGILSVGFSAASAADAADAARRQAAARERVAHLKEALRRLIEKYAADPREADKRKRLEEALARIDREGVSFEMEEVLRALESSDVGEAKARAAKAREALRQVLDVLTLESKLSAIQERRQTIEEATRAIERLAQREQELIDEARRISEAASTPELREVRAALDRLAASQGALLSVGELAAARGKAADLLARQKALSAPDGAEPQEALAREARELAADLASSAGTEAAAQAAVTAAGRMEKAAGAGAEQALAEVVAEIDRRIAGASAEGGEGTSQEVQETLAREAEDLSRKAREAGGKEASPDARRAGEAGAARIEEAAGEMRKALKAMEAPSTPSEASGYQRQAIRRLAEARESLEELSRARLSEEDRQALARLRRRQEEVREETHRIAEALQLDKDLGGDAAADVQKAADLMAVVEGFFREEFVDSGIWEAREALKYLRRASARARDKQRQYAAEQIQVTLSGLQKEIDRLIAGQEEARKRTEALLAEAAKGGGLGIWGEESTGLVGEEQLRLAGLAGSLKETLSDPRLKSTIYLWAAGEALDKMTEAGTRLVRSEVSRTVVDLQSEAIFLLEQMREGLKGLMGRLDEEKRRGRRPRAMAPGEDVDMPFVTNVDEIRLLLSMQKQINARTAAFSREVGPAGTMTADQREKLTRLMRDQAKIRELGNDWRLNVYQEQR